MNLVFALDLFGTLVFAFSGALVARKREMDVFGLALVGLVTAVGGGSLRDMLLGASPVFWIERPVYLLAGLCGVCVALALPLIQRSPPKSHSLLIIADAIGISVFAVIGAQKALSFSPYAGVAVLMGTFTAVMGGIFRDIICNQVPLILRKEIYATACIAGAAFFVLLVRFKAGVNYSMLAGGLLTFAVRLTAVRYGLSLPRLKLSPAERDSNASAR